MWQGEARGSEPLSENWENLTDRQLACLRLVQEGLNSKEIAAELGLSHNTVDRYLYLASVALGVQNRRQAAKKLKSLETDPRYKQFIYKSEAVAAACGDVVSKGPDPNGLAFDNADALADLPSAKSSNDVMSGSGGRRPGFLIGGRSNALTIPQRVGAIMRISLLSVTLIVAIILLEMGALKLLS